MYCEDELWALSALQHLVFCERQCALIHIEQVWKDNPATLEGTHQHRRSDGDAPRREVRGDLVILRGLPLRSLRLGLSGRADVVELHRVESRRSPADQTEDEFSASFPGLQGRWTPFPVEYKRGRPKRNRCDEVQLCAQALCLEEMLGIRLAEGALFYGKSRRRHAVAFDADLRSFTEAASSKLHELLGAGRTPTAIPEPKCRSCSLLHVCLPETGRPGASARRYLDRAMTRALAGSE